MSKIDFSNAGHASGVLSATLQLGNVKSTLALVASLFMAYCAAQTIYRIWFHPLSKFPGPPLLAAVYIPYVYLNHVRGVWVRRLPGLHRKYGPAVRVGPNHIAFDGSIGWQEVYGHRKNGQKEFSKQPVAFPGDEKNLLHAPLDVHRRQRRQLSYAFSDSSLIRQESTICKYIDMLMERLWERAKQDQVVDIVEWLNFTTFDIIGDLTFSDSFHSLENNGYHPWVRSIFKAVRGIALRRGYNLYPMIRSIVDVLNLNSISKATLQIRGYAKEKTKVRIGLGEEPVEGHKDFITYMMRKTPKEGTGMSAEEIIATTPTLVLAGSETTATALSGFTFLMSKNPRVYAIVANEIRSTYSAESDITIRNTAAIEYLQAVIDETLRVYPPAAETPPRVCPGAMVDGKYIPAGARVSVSQWATFHNPDNFVEPEAFLPERWLTKSHPRYEERFQADNKAVFKPFSYGSRDCIGKNLAQVEMRYIIARLLYRFDFELASPQENWLASQRVFVLWDKGPLYLRLRPRKMHV
ncbi:hypothetical protein JDV02_002409 [Purpureocillium takamizusanense]|uniref:Isotrichodermin C-15 hydroxylase n=1 Tax=Purpureocillium takamizusanense TaxID=2060973 RepID=A0A9Q8QA89_9HYPO|nr:uncharacterized protein JDV02_002409 [Purpureocillium takamizusanense]UNI15925.1 hypothetical protein JDV02_002409 [Purpureocillium takamizusanense]